MQDPYSIGPGSDDAQADFGIVKEYPNILLKDVGYFASHNNDMSYVPPEPNPDKKLIVDRNEVILMEEYDSDTKT